MMLRCSSHGDVLVLWAVGIGTTIVILPAAKSDVNRGKYVFWIQWRLPCMLGISHHIKIARREVYGSFAFGVFETFVSILSLVG